MIRSLPARVLTETVTIEPYLGYGSTGPRFGPAQRVRAHVQHLSELPGSRSAGGTTTAAGTVTAYKVWINLGPQITTGARLTIRGRTLTAAVVDINDSRTLPGPRHIEIRAERNDFLASALVTILRGVAGTDTFGDLTDTETVVASDLEAAITEDAQDSSEPVAQRGGIVETYTIRFRAGTDVREGDRVRDQRSNTVYRVLDVVQPHSTLGPELGTDDVTATCRRVAATSTTP